MREINIIAVGKLKETYIKEAVAEYGKRLSKFCCLNIIEIPDNFREDVNVVKESAEILKKLSGFTVLTDINGEQVSSEGLAELLDKAFLIAGNSISFIIGGSNGVNADVKRRADKSVSFGKLTFPHQLMRVILLEQIYRAFSILSNMPYHK